MEGPEPAALRSRSPTGRRWESRTASADSCTSRAHSSFRDSASSAGCCRAETKTKETKTKTLRGDNRCRAAGDYRESDLRFHSLIPFDFTSQFEFVQRPQFLPTNIAPAFLSPLNVHRSQFDATLANSPPPG